MTCTSCQGELEADAMYCGHCGRRTSVRGDPPIGSLVDDTYRVDEKIASGGFGSIYRATHLPSGEQLALKVLHANFAADPAIAARFLRESKALAKLKSPHTVTTYERGEARDGTLYLAMELLRGESLEARLASRGALPWREVLAIMRAVCGSLAEAHAHGIVHRDLKPANIHLGADVKVLDFGVAKALPFSAIDDGAELTLAGQTVGTLEYMAPEQLSGGSCDARTDLYALGVVAYESITGRRPFADARNAAALITALFTETVPPTNIVPPAVDALLLRCLEREVDHRYASALELAAAIEQVLAEHATLTPLPVPVRSCTAVAGLQLATASPAILPLPFVIVQQHELRPFDIAVRGSTTELRLAPRSRWPIYVTGIVAGLVAIAIAWITSGA